jgi:transposase
VRRFDKKRKKKTSNKDWVSRTDPSSEVTRMKDGRTHLAYKCEHAIDLDSELLLSSQIARATQSDAGMLLGSVHEAQANLIAAGSSGVIEEVVADKGYHSTQALTQCLGHGVRTYIPERKSPKRRKWKGKPEEQRRAVVNNRRRVRGNRSKKLQRLRSEKVERSFAHTCNTGGARRTWLRGPTNIKKRYSVHAAGRNLGRIMFLLFGIGTPRGLQTPVSAVGALLRAILDLTCRVWRALGMPKGIAAHPSSHFRVGRDTCVSLPGEDFAA